MLEKNDKVFVILGCLAADMWQEEGVEEGKETKWLYLLVSTWKRGVRL